MKIEEQYYEDEHLKIEEQYHEDEYIFTKYTKIIFDSLLINM